MTRPDNSDKSDSRDVSGYVKGGSSPSQVLLQAIGNMRLEERDAEGKAMETRLEAELAEDSKPLPKSTLARVRRKGSKVLHSKHVLMAVVILNLVDCILVLGELILDIHFVRDVLEKSDISSQKFINKMETKYPDVLYNNNIEDMHTIYDSIYHAECTWNFSSTAITHRKRRSADTGTGTTMAATWHDHDMEAKLNKAHAHNVWEKVAHGLHKASIAILGILFLENLAKIFCAGVDFLSNKLEVFDACIVLISFTLDLVFLKGLTVYRIQDGILILSFLVPWRVIRVVNSLIVAVLDHEHFRLKLLYIRNKKISTELEELKRVESRFDAHLKKIEKFMETEGIPRWKIVQHTHFNKTRSTLVSMASMAMGGMLNGFMEKNAFQMPIMCPEIKQENDVIKPDQVDVTTDIDDITSSGNDVIEEQENKEVEIGNCVKENECDIDENGSDVKYNVNDVSDKV